MPATMMRRRAATRWSPGRLPTLEGWFRAQRITGLSDGGAVATWLDISGKGRDLTQATSGARPAWRKTGINGHACVDADGTDDWLQSASFTAIAQPIMLLLVGRMQTDPALNQQRRFFDGSADNQVVLYGNNQVANTKWALSAGAAYAAGVYDNNWHAFVALINGASSKLRVDGGAGTTGNAGSNTLAGFSFFNSGAGGTIRLMDGDIAEAAICSSSLSLANINLFGAYAAKEYGITWSTAT